jgi:hypothetical protein
MKKECRVAWGGEEIASWIAANGVMSFLRSAFISSREEECEKACVVTSSMYTKEPSLKTITLHDTLKPINIFILRNQRMTINIRRPIT